MNLLLYLNMYLPNNRKLHFMCNFLIFLEALPNLKKVKHSNFLLKVKKKERNLETRKKLVKKK